MPVDLGGQSMLVLIGATVQASPCVKLSKSLNHFVPQFQRLLKLMQIKILILYHKAIRKLNNSH